ncbi:MAG TPA: phosphoadenylyl-sulfate reductase [Terriglobales bacterium]
MKNQGSEIGPRNDQIEVHNSELPFADSWPAERVLTWAFDLFGREIAISSALGLEGMCIIDMASRFRGTDFRVFTLDTELLFPETYDLMHRVEEKYGITIERVYPILSPEAQENEYGAALWARDADACCNLRKVEPLRRKLRELRSWITGIRRDQTPSRTVARKIEWDVKFGLTKVNPIVDWSPPQVWRYIHDHGVPYNPLHDRGYPSIGCTHCTRSVGLGEAPRSGRWAGSSKTECGLHLIEPAANTLSPT